MSQQVQQANEENIDLCSSFVCVVIQRLFFIHDRRRLTRPQTPRSSLHASHTHCRVLEIRIMYGQEEHCEVFVRFQSFAMDEADGLVYETSTDLESGVLRYQSNLADVR